jgi:branched-chain amino acid transport system substrate-binding protein
MVLALFAGCGAPAGEAGQTAGEKAPIKIGMTGPLTGPAANYGLAVDWGMQIAVEEINAAAGGNGLKIEYKAVDDEHDGTKAVSGYEMLIDWGMQFFGGTVTSAPALQVAPMTVQDQVFMLTPSASNADVAMAGNNIFQMCFTDPNQGASAAELVKSKFPNAVVGMIYDASDDYSIGLANGFKTKAAELGVNIAVETSFSSSSNTELDTQVEQCKNAGCDLVFMPFYYSDASKVLKYADSVGYDPTFFGCDGMDGILAMDGFDPALAEGLMLMTPFSAGNPDEKVQEFVTKFKAKSGGVEPNQFAADGYDVVYAIYNACVACGIDGNTSNEEACAKLITYFTTNSFSGLTGTDLTWSEDGFVSKAAEAMVVKNGAYAAMD